MKPKWIIEDDAFPEDIKPLTEALEKQNIEHKVIPHLSPFKLDEWEEHLGNYPGEECVIFYGSLNTAKQLRKITKWIPGVYYNIPKYECVNYYAHLGEYLLNRNYILLPFGELKNQKEFLYHCLAMDRAIFIRPNRGDKIFTGKLVYKEKFEEEIERFGYGNIGSEELVAASEPKNLKFEWRFVVVEGKVITGSQYAENDRFGTEVGCPLEAFEFAEEIAAHYNPDVAWVIDVCQTKGGTYRLMEVGCFSCAGLYKCDLDLIVKAVSVAAVREWQSYND